MKELIVEQDGSLNSLFIFDPRRVAILLVGGDKTGLWNRLYATAIAEADRLYEDHLQTLRQEGQI